MLQPKHGRSLATAAGEGGIERIANSRDDNRLVREFRFDPVTHLWSIQEIGLVSPVRETVRNLVSLLFKLGTSISFRQRELHGIGGCATFELIRYVNSLRLVILSEFFHALVISIRDGALNCDKNQDGAILSCERSKCMFLAVGIGKTEISDRRANCRWRRHITLNCTAANYNDDAGK